MATLGTAAFMQIYTPWLSGLEKGHGQQSRLERKSLSQRLLETKPLEGWSPPDPETIKKWLKDPEFWTKPQTSSGRIFLTAQFDEKEYQRLNQDLVDNFASSYYVGNSCSEAVIATVFKLFTYYKTGEVPDITIADIINELIDKSYMGYDIIRPNDVSMQDDPFEWSFKLLEGEGGSGLAYDAFNITTDWGVSNSHLVPEKEWSGLFGILRKYVFDEGGVGLARVLKYGRPVGTMGHFIILGSINEGGELLIVDSIGLKVNGKRLGTARTLALAAYTEKFGNKGDEGLLWMAGVNPKGLGGSKNRGFKEEP